MVLDHNIRENHPKPSFSNIDKRRIHSNMMVTRKLRMASTKSIRHEQMYATANFETEFDIASLNMPYNGCMTVTVTSAILSKAVLKIEINNPYVNADTPVIVQSNLVDSLGDPIPKQNITVALFGPGKIIVAIEGGDVGPNLGTFTICTGQPTSSNSLPAISDGPTLINGTIDGNELLFCSSNGSTFCSPSSGPTVSSINIVLNFDRSMSAENLQISNNAFSSSIQVWQDPIGSGNIVQLASATLSNNNKTITILSDTITPPGIYYVVLYFIENVTRPSYILRDTMGNLLRGTNLVASFIIS